MNIFIIMIYEILLKRTNINNNYDLLDIIIKK